MKWNLEVIFGNSNLIKLSHCDSIMLSNENNICLEWNEIKWNCSVNLFGRFSVKALEVECLDFIYIKTVFVKMYECGFCHDVILYSLNPWLYF